MTDPLSHNKFLLSLRTYPKIIPKKNILITKTDNQKAKCEICHHDLSINEYLAKKKFIKYCSPQCLYKYLQARDKLLH